MKSPSQHLIPSSNHLPDNVPFKEALDLTVEVSVNDRGITDVYIDDLMPVYPNLGDNVEREFAAVSFSLHIIGSLFKRINCLR